MFFSLSSDATESGFRAAADDDLHLRRDRRRRPRRGYPASRDALTMSGSRPSTTGTSASSDPVHRLVGTGLRVGARLRRTAARSRRADRRAASSAARRCDPAAAGAAAAPPPPRPPPPPIAGKLNAMPAFGAQRRVLPGPAVEVHHRDFAAEDAAARHHRDGRDRRSRARPESRRSRRDTPRACAAAG